MTPGSSRILAIFALLSLAPLPAAPPALAQLGKRTVQEKKLYENVYTVCIGVDGQSRDDLIPPLRFAGNDAKAMHEVFTNRYGYDSQLLTGPDATRANILKAVRFATGGAGESDVVILYFAGHGQTVTPVGAAPHEKVGYLIAYDTEVDFTQPITDVKAVDAQAVPMADVVKLVADSRAAHVLLILDCCFSGFAADLDTGTRAITPGERQMLADLLSEPTRQVFTAGTSDQKSLEVKQLQHGLFTYHLVNELNTTPNDIYSLVEAFAAVRGKVSADAAKGNGRMTPQLRQLKPSNGDWVFIDKAISEEALTRYEAKPKPRTTQEEYETFTASARSAEAEKGEGALRDDPEYAAKHAEYKQRADTGDPIAMAIVSEMEANGWGVSKDEGDAFFWAQQAFSFDDSATGVGTKSLANKYEHGIGVEKNPAMAQSLNEALGNVLNSTIQKSLTGGDTNLSNQEKANLGVAAFNEVASWFGAGGKIGDIGKLRHELRDAAASAKADKVDDKLKNLEKALAALLTQSQNAEGKLAPAFAAKLGEVHAELAPHAKKARQWESLGAFNKIEDELKKMDPALATLAGLMPR